MNSSVKHLYNVAFVCILLVLSGCSTEKLQVYAASETGPPKIFNATIGGFLGTSYSVELQKGVLIYKTQSGNQRVSQIEIIPTVGQWDEFRRSLDSLKVWQWRLDYPNPQICDGTQWSLDIEYSDHLLRATGDNNYPTASGRPNGKPHSTKTFESYLAAIQRLLGGKEFK